MKSLHWIGLAGMALLMGCNDLETGRTSDRQTEEYLHATVQESFALGDLDNWRFRTPSLWQVVSEEGRTILKMSPPPQRPNMAGGQRPQEYAIYSPYEFRSFSLSAWVRLDQVPADARDAVILFGRQDATHLYYVHLSGGSDAADHAIIRVDGDRHQRLTAPDVKPPAMMTDQAWHKVDLLRNADTGLIQVYVDAYDENAEPYFQVVDKTYEWGFVGIGSLAHSASFARILIDGQSRRPGSPPVIDPANLESAPE